MSKETTSKTCCIEGCNQPIKGFDWCRYHYQKYYKFHPNYKPREGYNDRRKHPLYVIWWQRKRDNLLCSEWLDFKKFIEDVGLKPDGNFFLVRLRNEPFGPDNFKWLEHLKKQENESFRKFWARKRAARIAANPSMESERNLKRKYNLTKDQYNEKLKSQNNCCAICKIEESSVDARTGSLKGLAVDHCHTTKKIRGLLCWRCNGTLGKVNDDIELLKSMIDYLEQYKDLST